MSCYRWAVIGAGPAGIAAVGRLIDHGVVEKDIVWIDPQFKVGDFGLRWQNIPSNTKVDLFLKFLHSSDAFAYSTCDQHFELNDLPPHKTCYLRSMVAPLQWVTQQLTARVHTLQDKVISLAYQQNKWHIRLSAKVICAERIILAIGAEPKILPFSYPIIALQDAMDEQRLKHQVCTDDVIAVFGSSHSAVLALKNLTTFPVKKIINFYRSPLCYAIYTENEILFDDTGLKGTTADWARDHLHENLPSHLLRVYSNEENIQQYLPQCTKVVFAIGFERRVIPIEGLSNLSYCDKTGVIAPGLFGLGIAFPEAKTNTLGLVEYRVGLWKFMDYLHRVMPLWLKATLPSHTPSASK